MKAHRPLYVTWLARSRRTFFTFLARIPCANVIKEVTGWNIVMQRNEQNVYLAYSPLFRISLVTYYFIEGCQAELT